jgi:Tfp pilus assembly protein PilF
MRSPELCRLKVVVLTVLLLSSSLSRVESFGVHHQGGLTSRYPSQTIRERRRTAHWSVVPQTKSESSTPKNGKQQTTDIKHNRRKSRSMFQSAKVKEKAGQWKEASEILRKILKFDPTDAHTHLGLARLEAKREQSHNAANNTARAAFEAGTHHCPESVHIWQAWARYEESCSHQDRARELFLTALEVEEGNPYVCHSYGLMEKKLGNPKLARDLWEQGLRKKPTAALVCSLAELFIEQKLLQEARDLYLRYLTQVETEREMTEIYLASAWLEEKYFRSFERAEELIELALVQSPSSGRAQIALARLEGRTSRRENKSGKPATRKRLSEAVRSIENGESESTDGRLFNALAHVEVKSRKFDEARKILEKGIERYPDDVSVSRLKLSRSLFVYPLLCSHTCSHIHQLTLASQRRRPSGRAHGQHEWRENAV